MSRTSAHAPNLSRSLQIQYLVGNLKTRNLEVDDLACFDLFRLVGILAIV